jgi:hypothetical protein
MKIGAQTARCSLSDSESHGSSSARVRKSLVHHRPIAMWSCARNPYDDDGSIAIDDWMDFRSFFQR